MMISITEIWLYLIGWLIYSGFLIWLGSRERRLDRYLAAIEVLAFVVFLTVMTWIRSY